MKINKNIIYLTLAILLASVAYVSAAPSINYLRHTLPETDNIYDLGTSTQRWARIYGTTFYGDGSNLTGITTGLPQDLYSTSSPTFGGLTITGLSGMAKFNASGILGTATSGIDYQSPLSVITPLSLVANVLSMPTSTASQNGFLSAADWTTFNSKITTSSISETVSGLSYDNVTGVFSTSAGYDGLVATASGTAWNAKQNNITFPIPVASTSLTGGLGLTLTTNDMACDTANDSTFGCLPAVDWQTFNNKQSQLWGLSGSNLFASSTSWNVGIGTTTPSTLFSVGTSTNIFNVLSTGDVGIGIASPSVQFQIEGRPASNPVMAIHSAAGYTGSFRLGSGVLGGVAPYNSWDMRVSDTALAGYYGAGDFSIAEGDGGTNFLIQAVTGNIGIGTTTPAYKLTVVGTTKITGALTLDTPLTDANISSAATWNAKITTSSISETITGIDYNNTTGVFSMTNGYEIPTTASTSAWNAGGSGGGLSTSTPFSAGYVPIATSTTKVTNSQIYQSGAKIGIGTTTPASQLTVQGDFSLSGGTTPTIGTECPQKNASSSIVGNDSAGTMTIGSDNTVGNNAQTVVMLHLDGTASSTTITDVAAGGTHTWTTASSSIDTTQYKFGGASLLMNNKSGGYASTSDSADWSFGSGDFTIDWWMRFKVVTSPFSVIHQGATGNVNRWIISGDVNTDELRFRQWTASALDIDVTVIWDAQVDTWYHMALVRNGNNWMWFANGTQIATTTVDASAVNDHTGPFYLGADGYSQPGSGDINGWIDEFRITKGLARWTSNFTPPTSPYTTSAAINSCSMTFATAKSLAPRCFLNNNTTSTALMATTTVSTLTVKSSADMSTSSLDYFCIQR